MSYEVTANRKRPTQFDGLLGQEFVVATLKNSLRTGRIAHAYLFSGPRGVGKTSAARILARSLNCPDGPSADGCPDYEEGEAISRGTALDVIEIDGASNTSVNDVRQIKDEVLFAPQSARYKIYIIDEVHMLSNSAFNALLKTIEEPPPYIVFIFATTEVHKVPATIRSRCQQFHFRLIPMPLIAGALRETAGDLSLEAEEDALLWIAREAGGSLRDAFTLFDQVASFSEGHIALSSIQEKLGLVGFEQLDELARLLGEQRPAEALELVDSMLGAGISIEQVTVDFAEYLRTALLVKHGIRKTGVLGRPADQISEEVIESFTAVQLQKGTDMLLELFRNLRYSLNPRFELELTVSRLSELTAYLSPREMLDEISRLRHGSRPRHPALSADAERENAAPGRKEPAPADRGSAHAGAGPTPTASDDTPGTASRTPRSSPESPTERSTAEDAIKENRSVPESEDDSLAREHGDSVSDEPYPHDVRRKIIATIRERKLALGSILEKAVNWVLHDGALVLQFNNGYHARAVKQDSKMIRATVSEITGDDRPVKAAVLHDDSAERSEEKHSAQVDLVKRVFRGEVIDGDGEEGSP